MKNNIKIEEIKRILEEDQSQNLPIIMKKMEILENRELDSEGAKKSKSIKLTHTKLNHYPLTPFYKYISRFELPKDDEKK